eukprot:1162071-Pelagomonas_calceolata.AAC.2
MARKLARNRAKKGSSESVRRNHKDLTESKPERKLALHISSALNQWTLLEVTICLQLCTAKQPNVPQIQHAWSAKHKHFFNAQALTQKGMLLVSKVQAPHALTQKRDATAT